MGEIFEIDDVPAAASSATESKEKAIANDKHLPSFDFDKYPMI